MPGVEDFAVSGRNKAYATLGHALRDQLRRVVFIDDAGAGDPIAMLAAADEGPAPLDPITASDAVGAAGEDQAAAGGRFEVAIHFASDAILEERAVIAAVAVDHRAPADGAVGLRQRLDHPYLHQRIQFRTAPRARHRHAEDTRGFHRADQLERQPAPLLDRGRRRANLRTKRARRLQDPVADLFAFRTHARCLAQP